MNGETLYGMYVSAYALQNCEVDSWASLLDEDKAVWNTMAGKLMDDTRRMNFIEAVVDEGCFTTCFELTDDGGYHVTIDRAGGEQEAHRNVDSVRDGIDAARKLAGAL